MPRNWILNPRQKALEINLDDTIYGTFAEIGAGQEVARHFFTAGGAAGTIAKSMSAYDMTVSDAVYGKTESGRYVCESRLKRMFDHEYKLTLERLSETRPKETRFFAFADTVEAKSFKGNRDCHGWLGLRFQHKAKAEASECVLHVRMLDNQNLLQQEALGIIGVNLIHACFNFDGDLAAFVGHLMDNLTTDRVEIDMIRSQGPAFNKIDMRLLNLELIRQKYTQAVLFDEKGMAQQPSEVLYKKNVLVLRGSFRPPTLVNIDMLNTGLDFFKKELGKDEQKNVTVLPEISMSKLLERGEIDGRDFLARVDLLNALGHKVLISNKRNFGKLSQYLSRLTTKKIVFVIGVYNLEDIFKESNYKEYRAGLMGALGGILGNNTKLYIYPGHDDKTGDLVDCRSAQIKKNQTLLLEYLIQNKFLIDLPNYDDSVTSIWSRVVLKMIEEGQKGWEKMVPAIVSKTVKKKKLFGHKRK